jgi:hypothetical protein
MEEMLINERFKSPNKEFEKVYAIFDKRDYFNNKGLAKTQIGNFKRALEKNDKGAQKLLDAHKGNMDSAISYIEEFISDGNKRKSFESFQEFSSMVNALEMSTKPNLKQKPAEFIKRRIHNNSQKYTIALYSAIRKQKFNNYKDVHKDVDELVSKNESVNEGKFKVDDLVYNKRTKTVGIVRMGDDKYGEVKTDADGNVDVDKLEKYNPIKFKHQTKAKVAPSTEKEVSKRGLFNPFKNESVNEGKKRYYQQDRVGSAKYTISYHDGKKKHKDGSDFFDIQTFKNKKDLAKFVNTLHKGGYVYGFGESVNEAKYNYKADALTAYFKGKIDAKELDKIARDDFKSGIATKKELSNFLSNKFTQDVMSDTYGIPAGTLIKRVRGLMKFAEGKGDGVPQGYNPMVEDKSEIKGLVKKVGNKETKFYDVLSVMEKKYGKNKYRIWLEKSLKDFGVNPKHYDYRTNAAVEEKLFQLGK